ncbi:MAG: flotillin family protein, partial [Akkermansiaceae bacterium]|nr:flotillin family protein [Akkermansiaceae bacterium]
MTASFLAISPAFIGGVFALVILVLGFVVWVFSRYKRCPPDRVLVIYGKTGADKTGASSRCVHGGGTFVWPVIQDSQFLDLTPIPIDIRLEGALSQQNIRINTPSTFTVGVSVEPGVMQNAAERMLGLTLPQIQELAKDIIFGQMRVVIATMPIEEINADRDKLIDNISNGVEVELKKVGLRLINVNVQDITDESGYIDALGQEAAARAINDAKIKVAEQQRDGEIGKAKAEQTQRIQVAAAQATATEGENEAKITVAKSDALRREAEAEANRKGSAAERVKAAAAQQESYTAEEQAERERARREEATQYADIVVPAEIEKQRIATLAEAEAEKRRREEKGKADGIRSVMEAEAAGVQAQLTAKADGFRQLIASTDNNHDFASLMMIIEQLPELVGKQVEAISNLKIDKVTVWDGGNGSDGNGNATSDFLANLVKSVPPLQELTRNVGVKLPEYLGTMMEGDEPAKNDRGGKKDETVIP